MNRTSLVLILSLSLSGYGICQTMTTGIYFTIENEKADCHQRLSLNNTNTYYCLEIEPIISIDEFLSISEVYHDASGYHHVDIDLTPTGLKNLNRILSELPQWELAIVVSERLIGIITAKEGFPIEKITITEDPDSRLVLWIHHELSRAIPENRKSKDN